MTGMTVMRLRVAFARIGARDTRDASADLGWPGGVYVKRAQTLRENGPRVLLGGSSRLGGRAARSRKS